MVEPNLASPAAGQIDHRPQCWRCQRTLAGYLARPWSLRCHRCGAQNNAPQ